MLAFVTNGEGYHNFHHRFPSDFRNGIRWYQWDPTKWLIRTLAALRLATGLRRTDRATIEKTRLELAMRHAEGRFAHLTADVRELVRTRLEAAARFLERAAANRRRAHSVRRGRRAERACLARARKERRAALALLSATTEAA
jgi:stearoyl-CoA desaturase (delta-9 desaturase)